MRYGKIHSQIWFDENFRPLSEDARTLFLYLLTCPHGNAIGLFVLPDSYAIDDLQWDAKRYAKPFRELLDKGLIMSDPGARIVCIVNHLKHNPIENENQTKAAAKIVPTLPKSSLYSTLFEQLRKPYHKPLLEQLRERYGEPEAETGTGTGTETGTEAEVILSGKPDFEGVIAYLNDKTSQKYRSSTGQTKRLIQARWNEGFRLGDFCKVVDNKCAEWLGDAKMEKYLRPETLFGTKFESYLNATPKTQMQQKHSGALDFVKKMESAHE